MSTQDFLVEIGTEELPPTSLKKLSDAFSRGIVEGLKEAGLEFGETRSFCTPRRLAFRVQGLQTRQPVKAIEKRGPAKKAAFDANGNPTKALEGFSRSLGVDPSALEEMETPKGTWMVYRATEPGRDTLDLLPDMVQQSLNKLPIPKRMRWGASKVEFVRPVHWILMLLGNARVPGRIMDIETSTSTRGHRFHCPDELPVNDPNSYEQILLEQGKVIADHAERKRRVHEGVQKAAQDIGGQAVIDDDLLEEVASLNEWPVPLPGKFDEKFLKVPPEALISSMKEHQKYFHVVDEQDSMLPYFITIANIESSDPAQVIHGNERVIRPRLSDAAFFFETDQKTTLAHKREALKSIVFQSKLGTIYDKTERVAQLAAKIAEATGGDAAQAQRSGELAKSDLVSEMVLEFSDLQGLMGMYYARIDGEPEEVARALYEQYWPRHAGGALPTTATGSALAIAEKLDSLVGLFGINQPPTGTKDPFALRRASLGVLRILVEQEIDLDLTTLIDWAMAQYPELENKALKDELINYFLDRFRAWYEDEGISAEVFLAVNARRPTRPLDFDKRIKAVNAFYNLPEAAALSAANKRVSNILDKQDENISDLSIASGLLSEDAEQELAKALEEAAAVVKPMFEQGQYKEALASLASLQQPVDRFFDDVMVMAEDDALRKNRLALLSRLRELFLKAADVSLLSR